MWHHLAPRGNALHLAEMCLLVSTPHSCSSGNEGHHAKGMGINVSKCSVRIWNFNWLELFLFGIKLVVCYEKV